jgi:epoxyqueuosine reductase
MVTLFPYLQDDSHGNLSRYARVPDYHITAGNVLRRAASAMQRLFPNYIFLPFIDNSPVPEVQAASLAGLGCIGDNGLLIHPVYGSWVFIGSIITNLAVPISEHEVTHCLHCGLCSASCPGHCLETNQRETCLSHITQKKGALTAEEQQLILNNGMIWGCDRCQEVCPLNTVARIDPHPCFQSFYIPSLDKTVIEDLSDKAYGWRGPAVLKRNLSLIDDKRDTPYNEK